MGILQNCFLNVVNPPPDGPVWYLRAVFVFCLLGPFFYVVIRLLNRYLVILLLVIAVACGKYPSPYPMYGLAAFVVGGIMAYHKINLVDFFLERRKMFLSVAMGAVVASFLIHFLGYTNISEPADIFKFLSMPIFICLADRIHILMNNQLIKKWIFPAAFTIYCSHMIVNSIAMHALGGALPPFHGRMIIIAVLTIGIDIIIPLIIWNLLNKVSPRFLTIIDGRL